MKHTNWKTTPAVKAMLAVGSLLLFACVLSVWTSASYTDSETKEPANDAFVGVWKAEHQGKTFVLLRLRMEDKKLSGIISTGDVNLDKDGEVSEVTQEAVSDTDALDLKRQGDLLTFRTKEEDEENHYEMKLTGENQAELKLLLNRPLPAGMPTPKPFKLTRGAQKP